MEGALEKAIKSVSESRQKYGEDKTEWEKKLAASDAENVQLGNKVKDLERENKDYAEKLSGFGELENN